MIGANKTQNRNTLPSKQQQLPLQKIIKNTIKPNGIFKLGDGPIKGIQVSIGPKPKKESPVKAKNSSVSSSKQVELKNFIQQSLSEAVSCKNDTLQTVEGNRKENCAYIGNSVRNLKEKTCFGFPKQDCFNNASFQIESLKDEISSQWGVPKEVKPRKGAKKVAPRVSEDEQVMRSDKNNDTFESLNQAIFRIQKNKNCNSSAKSPQNERFDTLDEKHVYQASLNSKILAKRPLEVLSL